VTAVVDDTLLAASLALAGRRLCVLTGAGVSTDSGIPGYRGEGSKPRRPLRYDAFVGSDAMRRRYWARAFVGWPRIRDARPNRTHDVVATLTASGRASGVITQNVDGLHQRAGAGGVVELHGSLAVVRCLGCGDRSHRDDVQARLAAQNPAFVDRLARGARVGDAIGAAPDGDVDLDDALVDRFTVVDCARCGGVLKPDVVFFGENVAPAVRAAADAVFADASALLVLGTSLEVLSGRRYVEEALRRRWPVVLITRGPTRVDDLVTVKLDGGVGECLEALFAR
jgi:NAD-dependent SIR2 family protein deacetylase